jgi:hypothetical protein
MTTAQFLKLLLPEAQCSAYTYDNSHNNTRKVNTSRKHFHRRKRRHCSYQQTYKITSYTMTTHTNGHWLSLGILMWSMWPTKNIIPEIVEKIHQIILCIYCSDNQYNENMQKNIKKTSQQQSTKYGATQNVNWTAFVLYSSTSGAKQATVIQWNEVSNTQHKKASVTVINNLHLPPPPEALQHDILEVTTWQYRHCFIRQCHVHDDLHAMYCNNSTLLGTETLDGRNSSCT